MGQLKGCAVAGLSARQEQNSTAFRQMFAAVMLGFAAYAAAVQAQEAEEEEAPEAQTPQPKGGPAAGADP
jgi:hypothetical protein